MLVRDFQDVKTVPLNGRIQRTMGGSLWCQGSLGLKGMGVNMNRGRREECVRVEGVE